jgi:predicted amidohydrolase
MKVTLLQIDIAWGCPQKNIEQAQLMIEKHPGADLYVLPEMWSTGFATQPTDIAEEEDTSVSLAWMRSTARHLQCAICGSLAVRLTDGSYRNRHYFVDGQKDTVCYYDKHHLFTYGGEHHFFHPGDRHTVVNYQGFRLLLLTCYDLRFPIWSRYSEALQFDAIICVANWPESRQNAFHILTRARAIENVAYLIAVNRVGDDDFNHYRGCSCVISPIGKTMVSCQSHVPQALSCDLDLQSLHHKREKFKVLADRDVL